MKYKVTFYKNTMHMLTERKANFVNKVKTLTSRVFDELAKKTGGNERTSALSIIDYLKNKTPKDKFGEGIWRVGITLDDYRNIALPMFPNTGQPIPFKFKFIINSNERIDHTSFNISGHCGYQLIGGQKFITEIYLEIKANFPLEIEPQKEVRYFINTFQSALTHEIAHAQDEYLTNEIGEYKERGRTTDEDLRYLSYWLKPTEIRSHMLEMIQTISSQRYNNPNRTFRNIYKTSDKAREVGMEHTDAKKEMTKRAYSIFNKKMQNKKIDEISMDALMTVLNRAFHGKCPKLNKKFIFDYHIAFIRDYNSIMKQRFYDKYFPNTESPSLEQMNDFFEAIKTVTRTFTKLRKEVVQRYRSYYSTSRPQEVEDMTQEFVDLHLNLWNNDELAPAFENYNPKLLKKICKKMIENFREQYNLFTKGMLTKQAKAYTRELNKKYKTNTSGMEDFFNSTPPR